MMVVGERCPRGLGLPSGDELRQHSLEANNVLVNSEQVPDDPVTLISSHAMLERCSKGRRNLHVDTDFSKLKDRNVYLIRSDTCSATVVIYIRHYTRTTLWTLSPQT